MQAAGIGARLSEAEGIVQRVDDAGWQLKVLVNGELWAFEVPANCRICLGEERVGLRRLQPLDHVRVAYEQVSGARVAHSIQASWFPFPHAAG
jgi:hypothetical protein